MSWYLTKVFIKNKVKNPLPFRYLCHGFEICGATIGSKRLHGVSRSCGRETRPKENKGKTKGLLVLLDVLVLFLDFIVFRSHLVQFPQGWRETAGQSELAGAARTDLVQVPVQTRRRERVDSARREEGPATPELSTEQHPRLSV